MAAKLLETTEWQEAGQGAERRMLDCACRYLSASGVRGKAVNPVRAQAPTDLVQSNEESHAPWRLHGSLAGAEPR